MTCSSIPLHPTRRAQTLARANCRRVGCWAEELIPPESRGGWRKRFQRALSSSLGEMLPRATPHHGTLSDTVGLDAS